MMFSKPRDHYAPIIYLTLNLIFISNFLPYDIHKTLLLIPLLLFAYLFKISLKWIAITTLISISLLLIQQVVPEVKGLYISKLLNRAIPLNTRIVNYIFDKYPEDVSEVIAFVLLNRRDKWIFTQFQELGIVFLVTISGIHFLFLRKLLLKLIPNKHIVLFLILLYWACIDYSIPALRIILGLFIKSKDLIRKWSYIALISLLFNIHIYRSLSFLLSYFFSLIFTLNKSFNLSTIKANILNTWSAFIFSTLVFLPYPPHRIHPLSILNVLIFTPIILSIFIYFFFTWFISSMLNIHIWISNIFLSLKKSFTLNTLSINLDNWDYPTSHTYLCLFSLLFVICLYKCSSYTTLKTRAY